MQSINGQVTYQDTVAEPKTKSDKMKWLVKKQMSINSNKDKISQLMEIDFKKFNINVNVADLLALSEVCIDKVFGNKETGYTQIIWNLKREYLVKRLSVSYASLKDIIKILLPNYQEVFHDNSLLTQGLNPRAKRLVKSQKDSEFEELCKLLLTSFRDDTLNNIQNWSKQDEQTYGIIPGTKPFDTRNGAKGSLIVLSRNGFLEGIWTHTANLLSLLILTTIMDKQI